MRPCRWISLKLFSESPHVGRPFSREPTEDNTDVPTHTHTHTHVYVCVLHIILMCIVLGIEHIGPARLALIVRMCKLPGYALRTFVQDFFPRTLNIDEPTSDFFEKVYSKSNTVKCARARVSIIFYCRYYLHYFQTRLSCIKSSL